MIFKKKKVTPDTPKRQVLSDETETCTNFKPLRDKALIGPKDYENTSEFDTLTQDTVSTIYEILDNNPLVDDENKNALDSIITDIVMGNLSSLDMQQVKHQEAIEKIYEVDMAEKLNYVETLAADQQEYDKLIKERDWLQEEYYLRRYNFKSHKPE